MICLGIETSCDETALALVDEGRLVEQTLASQADLHAIFGGVVPELASREHYRFIGALFDELLLRSGASLKDIDCVAVSRGPGLLGSLLVGNAFAKALAIGLNCPILGIDHLHAHMLAAGLSLPLVFPAVGLLVSGGHTHIYRIDSPSEFLQLGRSLDDAAGEVFDKVGHVLGFQYPAGKKIDELARQGSSVDWHLPRPYLNNDNLDFSFSGLKTAAIVNFQNHSDCSFEDIANFCHELNLGIGETLAVKTRRALEKNKDVRALWLAGGVAANFMIRAHMASLAELFGLKFIVPEIANCTDNAAMVAYAGWLLAKEGYCNRLDFEVVPRGRPIPSDMFMRCQND